MGGVSSVYFSTSAISAVLVSISSAAVIAVFAFESSFNPPAK